MSEKPKVRELSEWEATELIDAFFSVHAESRWDDQQAADKLREDLRGSRIWIEVKDEAE